MKRHTLLTIGLSALLATLSHDADAKKIIVKTAPASKAVTPQILDAVSEELERALSAMRIPGAPAPYFIGYKITEVDVHDVVASLGSVTDEQERDLVTLEAHVHVGSYDKDNSNFIASGRENLDGTATVPLALEASPARAQRSAWLATDQAYKEAITQWQAKNEAIASGASNSTANFPSYSKSKAIVTEDQVMVAELTENADLAIRAASISAGFRGYGHIRDSRVAFTSFLENRWYLNSEGTNASDTRRVEGVSIVATAQANDGQEVLLAFTRYDKSGRGLPNDKELAARVKEMAEQLEKLSKAPLVSNYTGPVLFEGNGAVSIVRHSLAPHLTGTPPPVGVSSTDALLAGKLAGRIGLKVISDQLSIVDDPSTGQVGKRFVIGGYKFDDEGVAPKRVVVVKNGRLVELLTSRTPNSIKFESNGHARLSLAGGVFRGSPTNLIVSGKKGKSPKSLRKALLAEAKAQGLPYAIIIKRLDDVALSANTELSRLALVQILNSMNRQAPPHATLAYRIYQDGREELVRGVQLEPLPMRAWRDLIGVGKTSAIQNFLATTQNRFVHRVTISGPGRVPSAGIESSVSTPDLLFQELDLKTSKFGLRPKAAIPAPN